MKLKFLFYKKSQKINYFLMKIKKNKVYFFLLNLLLKKKINKLNFIKKKTLFKRLKITLIKLLNINILYLLNINKIFNSNNTVLKKKKNYINLNIKKYNFFLKVIKIQINNNFFFNYNIFKLKKKKKLLKYSKFFFSNKIRYLVVRGKKKNMFVNLYFNENNLYFSSIGSSGLNKKSWWDKNIKYEIVKKSLDIIKIPEKHSFMLCYKGFISYWKVILDAIYKQTFIIGIKFKLLLPHNGCRPSLKKNRRKQWKKEKKKIKKKRFNWPKILI